MRTRAVLTVLTLVPVLLSAQQRGQDTRPGIAVFPFANGGSYGQSKEDFDALERGIAGMMISELAQNPAARVVEREQVQRLLDEQNLGAQGRVDPQTASQSRQTLSGPAMSSPGTSSTFTATSADARLVNTETSEIVKTRVRSPAARASVRHHPQRRDAASMKDANLPALQRAGVERAAG
jgi:curli biogenesis system outer membrane secretion channel CsgG